MRSAACRRGRCAQGLASGDLCSSSLHHLISGRTALARTHIPHACGHDDGTHLRNRLFVGPRVARSPSIPRLAAADAATPTRWLKRLDLCRLEHRSLGHKAGCEIAPERHDQLARQGYNRDALDALAGIECASPILLGEFTVRLMSQPQPGHLDRGATGARVARLADPLVAIDPAALPRTGRQPEIAR